MLPVTESFLSRYSSEPLLSALRALASVYCIDNRFVIIEDLVHCFGIIILDLCLDPFNEDPNWDALAEAALWHNYGMVSKLIELGANVLKPLGGNSPSVFHRVVMWEGATHDESSGEDKSSDYEFVKYALAIPKGDLTKNNERDIVAALTIAGYAKKVTVYETNFKTLTSLIQLFISKGLKVDGSQFPSADGKPAPSPLSVAHPVIAVYLRSLGATE